MARLTAANAESTQATTLTALRHLSEFAAGPARRRQLFVRPRVQGDVAVAAHNEWTLMLWAEHLLSHPSKVTGQQLAVDTVATYVSLAKTELAAQLGYELIGTSERRLRRLFKAMRRAQPVRNRRKRRGLRGHHLRKAFRKMHYGSDRSRQATAEWAALATAREAVARGSELCPGKFDPKKPGPTRGDLTFERDEHGRTATLWLRPLKKRGRAAAAKVPIVFAEYDGGGSDTFAALRRMVRADPVPPSAARRTPLFRHADGSGFSCRFFRGLVRSVAGALGFAKAEFGGHSPRIGGASDLGDESPLLLQAKGRWAGDLGAIYCRLTRRGLVRASHKMQKSSAVDMEELYEAFAQPA